MRIASWTIVPAALMLAASALAQEAPAHPGLFGTDIRWGSAGPTMRCVPGAGGELACSVPQSWLAANPQMIPDFLGSRGAEIQALRVRISQLEKLVDDLKAVIQAQDQKISMLEAE